MSILSGAYFKVMLIGVSGALEGDFMHVDGLGMEMDYQVYNEGGSNYPRFFFNGTRPTQLVLSHGNITNSGIASLIMIATNSLFLGSGGEPGSYRFVDSRAPAVYCRGIWSRWWPRGALTNCLCV